ELDEVRKLLAVAADGVDREPPRRQPVARAGAQRAEIARAEEHDDLILVRGTVQRVMHSEAAVIEIAPLLGRQRVLAVVEVGARGRDVADLEAADLVPTYSAVLLALVEEHHLERQRVAAPKRVVRSKPYVA